MPPSLPLSGVRVVELAHVAAGPFAGMLLADLGADVVKVEPPNGDDTRGWGPPFLGDDEHRQSLYYLSTNRNKRGIVLDLSTEQGQEVARRLADRADVLVENFRPGTLERWGLDYATLSARNERLIHVAISGFGQTGPHRDKPGYDILAQAMGGIMSLTGQPDGPPTKIGLPVADLNAGTWAIVGVLMALHARHTTGRGQYLDVSLLDAQTVWHTYAAQAVFHDEKRARRLGVAHPTVVPYQPMDCADGTLVVAVGSERLWARFCGVLGLDELVADPRFADNAARSTNRDELMARVEEVMTTEPVAHWAERFEAAGVPCGPINTLDDLYADPWSHERGHHVTLEQPGVGTYVGTGFPVQVAGEAATPPAPSGPPPTMGQHTSEVLRELGYTDEEIARF